MFFSFFSVFLGKIAKMKKIGKGAFIVFHELPKMTILAFLEKRRCTTQGIFTKFQFWPFCEKRVTLTLGGDENTWVNPYFM